MAKVLAVRDWDGIFENNRSRAIDQLRWVPMPNAHDGAAYLELMDGPEGAAHYGCWALIVQVASKCAPRGVLVRRSGQPHTPETLARQVHVPAATMQAALERLVQLGWLVEQNGAMADTGGHRRTPADNHRVRLTRTDTDGHRPTRTPGRRQHNVRPTTPQRQAGVRPTTPQRQAGDRRVA